jgi:hypothetical protein
MPWSDVLVMMTSCRTKPGLTTTFQIRRAAGGAVASFRLLRHNWPRPRSETSPEPLPFHLDPTQHGKERFLQDRHVLRDKKKSKGEHPEAEEGQEAEDAPEN